MNDKYTLDYLIRQAAHDIYKNINTVGHTEKKIKQILGIAAAEYQDDIINMNYDIERIMRNAVSKPEE